METQVGASTPPYILGHTILVPKGTITIVISSLDIGDDLHRFIGVLDGVLVEFHLFDTEVKQLE